MAYPRHQCYGSTQFSRVQIVHKVVESVTSNLQFKITMFFNV